ncbi:pyruvate kinase [Striga asiatica]|uniref:Pyruvate kinase n=1 Tax=Striga asiatica TaxID=4170 RepID=A0A5A7QYJ2_STRAF|nr:pyruvate kinase [Striga asiatica]
MFCSKVSANCSIANGKHGSTTMLTSPCHQRPKTKIVCTLGPSSRSVETLEELLKAGMSVARFNFSHGTHAYHQETLDNLREAIRKTGILCAVMLDTKGPEIRTGFLKEGKPIQLQQGQEITISTDYNIKGDEKMISMSYNKLAEDLRPQSTILCSDGTISLTVLECNIDQGLVRCRCENTAFLGERKNVNLPGVVVDLPTLTDKDRNDILEWGIPNKIDIIALSFVRKGSDLAAVENQEGVANLDDIIASSDAFMVARGDLGMEIPIEKIFLAQKTMIEKCNKQGKPVVTATQMLESMVKAPRPTRAEATDVANAVLDGTDCVMLSGETAAGAHPVEAVRTMARICAEAENYLDYDRVFQKAVAGATLVVGPEESLACGAVQAARSARAALIVVLGGTNVAKIVSKYRPRVPIVLVVGGDEREFGAGQGMISRGVIPVVLGCEGLSVEEVRGLALKEAEGKGLCRFGDLVVVVQHSGCCSSNQILWID